MTEEETIIERVVAGDIEAYRELVEMYQESVTRMIYQFLHDREASRDLAQDVFLAAFRNLRTYDPDRSQFSTWLYTIARNRSLHALRKKRPVAMSDPPELTHEVTPSAEAGRREVARKLDAALESLPARMKRVFVFAEIEGLPHAEIARIEGVSVGTVKSRMNRARAWLRESLKGLRDHE